MKTEKIEAIKKRFHREWLLIELDKVDESTTTPISGRLLFHSPHRDEVYSRLLSLRRRKAVLVENSADSLPKGYAAAF
ncbi:MAG: hypothetical protein A3G38_04635 [Omnitrophica WOR_2 bacterium RIFCSPLOWO2_12_FULL_51_8]|nr:MAG: hypothetical protein A3G38_04635 [Omnitrophica WOR_2 bacterium RIFCSPLOWO2_12_FULL_51_8]